MEPAGADGLPPLRDVIARYGLAARRALGQNFLLDLNLTAKIARAAGDLSAGTTVEIGPGPGGLTRALLAHGARELIAIERDARCLGALAEVAAAYPGHGDCWFQVARLEQRRDALPEAALHAAHSVHLGCPYYAEEAGRMRADASEWIAKRARDPQGAQAAAVACFARYFDGEPRQALEALALAKRSAGEEIAAQALEQAAGTYR